MRTVIDLGHGVIELNYMWLPTFIGMNTILKQEIEKDLSKKMEGIPLDERGLDRAHKIVIEYLVARHPEVSGLSRYLEAIKFVEL